MAHREPGLTGDDGAGDELEGVFDLDSRSSRLARTLAEGATRTATGLPRLFVGDGGQPPPEYRVSGRS